MKSFMTKYHSTGADESVSMILDFPKIGAHGIALTSIRVSTDPGERGESGPAVRIQGTLGEIQIFHPAFRPDHFRILLKDGLIKDILMPIPEGRGLFYEADEVARCIRDGKKESDVVQLEETVVVMETLDLVRLQGDLRYCNAIESSEYRS